VRAQCNVIRCLLFTLRTARVVERQAYSIHKGHCSASAFLWPVCKDAADSVVVLKFSVKCAEEVATCDRSSVLHLATYRKHACRTYNSLDATHSASIRMPSSRGRGATCIGTYIVTQRSARCPRAAKKIMKHNGGFGGIRLAVSATYGIAFSAHQRQRYRLTVKGLKPAQCHRRSTTQSVVVARCRHLSAVRSVAVNQGTNVTRIDFDRSQKYS
jgi:hypothetical protein